jgi:phage shock protein A
MAKREKRLEKGIASLEEQKALHEKKREIAKSLGQTELVRYYTKEIASLESRKKNREKKLKRKG